MTTTRTLIGSAGFTVHELLITLVIVGALATIGFPKASRALAQARVRGAASVVAGDLERAVSMAARTRRPVRFTCSAATRSYTVTDRASGTVLFSRALNTGSEFEVPALGCSGTSIDLLPHGVTTGPLTLELGSTGLARRVTITSAGLVRLL